jgi:4-amino-4-deoxy-L-arabinose transferase-like glycosyltransferase
MPRARPLSSAPPSGGATRSGNAGPRQLIRRFWGVVPIVLAIGLVALRAAVATPPLARLAPAYPERNEPTGGVVLSGSIYIARGGPVIFGFVSTTPTRLLIGSHEIDGRGLRESRFVVPAGPLAIRLAGGADTRLIWSPVGRRGDKEYVPASSLSPDPPDRASFPAWVGAAPFDAVIAAALLALLVGSLCMLARERLRRVPRSTYLAMAGVFALACIARWIDLGGFGQAWDEDVNWASGRNYITNLLSGDFRPESWHWNFEHPPVMKYLDGIGALLTDSYTAARALSAVWIALACALLVPIGTRLYRPRVGVLAGVCAALLPPLVAHGQIVGHESPSVLWWALAVAFALGVHEDMPEELHLARRVLRTRLIWLGVIVGIAFASRFINGLVGPLALAVVVIQAPRAWRRLVLFDAAWILPLTAAVTLYAVWPRLWGHPFPMLAESLQRLDKGHSPEPFLGEVTAFPPRYYFAVYLFATLPLGALVGVVAWFARSIRQRDRAALIVALWIVIPLAIAASPVRQDGVRYVMPTVAALALCAAAGWEFLATKLEQRIAHARRVFPVVAGGFALYLAVVLAWIHPYYLDYFAEQVGGPGTVASHGWFETAWWGEGVDRAVDYVNSHAATGARVYRDCIEPQHLAWFRYDLWAPMVSEIDKAEWIVAYAPLSRPCAVPKDAQRVFTVDAGGAVLAEVWQRTAVPAPPPPVPGAPPTFFPRPYENR